MNIPAASISVWAGEKIVCFKIGGRANFTASVDFRSAIYQLWDQGHATFVLDLTDCLLMDSTFLGVLSGIGLNFSAPTNGHPAATVELLNPNPRVADLLSNLGLTHLFRVAQGPPMNVERLACIEQAPANADRAEIARTCLEAHQTLMAINPANVPRFKDVAKFLAEDLRRLQADGSSSATARPPASDGPAPSRPVDP
jgi:anti-anti-sigma regulatory factor